MTKESLSIYDKEVLHLNFEKGSKNSVGYLEIINDALLFRSIKDGEEIITIPLTQIIRARTEVAVYTFWSTWRHYLWIYYKPDNKSTEKDIVFMLQRNAGIYGEEIKSKINSMLQSRGVTVDKDEGKNIYSKAKKLTVEEMVVVCVFILAFPVIFSLGQYIFAGLSMDYVGRPIKIILCIIYLCLAYLIICFTLHFIIWAVRALKEKIGGKGGKNHQEV